MSGVYEGLPKSWTTSEIGEVAEYVQRGKSPKYAVQSDLPVINQKCVRWWGVDVEHLKYIHPDQIPSWDEVRYLRRGDILWNSTGTGTIGRACVYRGELKQAVVDSHVTIIRTNPEIADP
ncbi:hypothetical protein N9L47_13685, partial [Rhodobacteraceae bacterium]|nr:hypothetical protein [Paracoccaceae bacterium]